MTSHMLSSTAEKKKHVTLVGGGLVGALLATYLAKRGFQVDVFEKRRDSRLEPHERVNGRSINLSLSCRGRESLYNVGLEEKASASGIPMYARLVHNLDGSKKKIPYGREDQFITSLDRRKLNEVLLTEAEKHPNVTIHFSHKFVDCDFETGEAHFTDASGKCVRVQSDLVVGCDGAYSAVRQQMMKKTRFDYSQEFIAHGYMELYMPPTSQGKHAMETNYLHLWPRNDFMMIALPNADGSFNVTLFMPFENFEAIQTEEDLIAFFEENFPDSIPLLGEQALKKSFFRNQPRSMISVKCGTYHYKDKVVLIGDAAHAMVPFYGQAMNCGFEDCLIFNNLLDKYDDDFGQVLAQFSATRSVDAQAMSDLAKMNYIEMRSAVNSKGFYLRKKTDSILHWLMPKKWIPLYTMVSFSCTRYHHCLKWRQRQDKILKGIAAFVILAGTLGSTAAYCYRN